MFLILCSLEKTLILGKTEGRRRGRHSMRWLVGITDSTDMSLSKLQELVGDGQGSLACCSPRGRKGSDTTERLNNNILCCLCRSHDPTQRSRVTFLLKLAASTLQELQWESLTSLNSSWAHPIRLLSRGIYCEMLHPLHVPTQMQTTGVNDKLCSVGSCVIASHRPFYWWKVNSPMEWHGADKKGFGRTLHHMF